MDIPEFPSEFATWQKRAEWLANDFCTTSKTSAQQFREFLAICNGDTLCDSTIVHWCKGPSCCGSEQESLQKAIKCGVPVLSRGYPVPLLHRFKHYETGASYIKTLCCTFNLLARILTRMAADNTQCTSELSSFLDKLLQDNQDEGSQGHFENSQSEPHNRLEELLDCDLSFSLQNGLRQRLVADQVCKKSFGQSSIIINLLVNRLEYGTNFLLKRTSCLSQIAALGSEHNSEYNQLTQESRARFLHIVSGDFGRLLLSRVVDLLNTGLHQSVEMGLELPPQRLLEFFSLIIACASDLWRRVILDFSGFPFQVFSWLDPNLSLTDFVDKWDNLIAINEKCTDCIDAELTAVLYAEHPAKLKDEPEDVQRELFNSMKSFLSHVATFTPLNSDTVEVKHGQMQWAISRRSAQFAKKPKASSETTLLQAIIRQHGEVYNHVHAQTMPSKKTAAAIRRQVGTSSANQYSKQSAEEGMFFATSVNWSDVLFPLLLCGRFL